jgi:hypothetical protein
MTRTLEDIRAAAMELTEEERVILSEELIATVSRDLDIAREWVHETERRLDDLKSGRDPGLTLDEFLADE